MMPKMVEVIEMVLMVEVMMSEIVGMVVRMIPSTLIRVCHYIDTCYRKHNHPNRKSYYSHCENN
jgi:hypothetical protein